MSDKTFDVAAAMDDRDVDLVMDFVVGELNEEGVEQLRRRIDRDPAFRRLAENIVAAWQIPLVADEPVDRAELMRSWDEFARTVGFTHQKRRARRRRIIFGSAVLAILLAGGWLARAPIAHAIWQAGFERVAGDTVSLADGSRAVPDSGATLEVHRGFGADTARWVRLTGSARFIVAPNDSMPRFYVLTPRGLVYTNGAEFAVRATADSTEVRGGALGAEAGAEAHDRLAARAHGESHAPPARRG